MNQFSIRQLPTTDRASFAHYEYEISDGTAVIARYWHDFRGNEHGIVFADGRKCEWPVGAMTDFLMGGGPKPLELSEAAKIWLREQLTG